MYEQECVPFAPSLIESMRSLGYSFPAAIADLIDNSISARASEIEIYSEPSTDPFLIIVDNGCGMDENELYDAMRYGSTNPLDDRREDDLGRFGLGLKSASLSQCRRFVVVSKKSNGTHALSWDIDHVIASGAWMLKGYSQDEISHLPMVELLDRYETGTYIILSDFDRIKEGASNIQETFTKNLDDMYDHLSLVFHRFISDGVRISVNGSDVIAMDPFLLENRATQRKRESNIYIDDQRITLKPFVLPHLSKLSQDDLKKVGGRERLRNDQGFYVYRNKRLIIWGTWFRLARKEELNKLARVMVDIPNSLDYLWSIDIRKSSASLPDKIKKNMYNAVYESVSSSEAVHEYRGRKEKKNSDIEYVWEKVRVRDGYEYQINRKIPQLEMLQSSLGEPEVRLLNVLLDTIEAAFPVQALYVDVAKGNIENKKEDDEQIEKLWDELQVQMEYVKKNGLPIRDYYTMFMKVEPFCNYKEIVSRIKEELSQYE